MNNHVYDLLKWSVLSGGNGDGEKINNQDKTITENGTYTADDGYTGLGTVVVNVASGGEEVNVAKGIIERTITEISDDTVEKVGDYAFHVCTSLKNANFPNATSIGARAFTACAALTEANIPNATGKIGENTFYNCQSLVRVNFPKIENIETYAFYHCDALTDVYLPSVSKIGSYAFQNSSSLKTVSAQNAITIQSSAFGYCLALTSADFPNATSIGSYSFSGCSALTSVNIVSATDISKGAFYACRELKSVRLPATPPTLSNTQTFDSINAACVFYIPTGSLSAYQAATNWSALTSTYTFTEEDR